MKLKLSIIGSTGSIGKSALSIVDKKKNNIKIDILSANRNFKLIVKQIRKYNPKYFIITDLNIFKKVQNYLKSKKTKIIFSFKNLKKKDKSDISILAIPGIAGLKPTLSMIKVSKKILIANKESIICGWALIKENSIKHKTKITPIDSEHFSIFQLLKEHNLNEIKKIYITASGGPFLNFQKKQLKKVKPKDALKHPKWKMGKKISIDSATLMNKILEIVEAEKLFNIPNKKLDIIIHPNSLVHAIIELKNGLSKFLYHQTSMIIPLANGIFEGNLDIDDFYKNSNKKNEMAEDLIFKTVNPNIFPIIKIKNRANEYSSTSIIINAANEILVDQFLQKKIPFLSISKIIMNILNDRNYRKYAIQNPTNINQIKKIDEWARQLTMKKL
tara:strand:+ start:3579 stop:4739 length:1161 start_codon:yes stop_codon:yes gene_type:complete